MRLCTFGDAVVDVVVALSRLPVPDDDVPADIALVAGGQAANVAAWAGSLGAQAAVITKLGNDSAGDLVRHVLAAHDVEVIAPASAGSSGIIASLVTPDGRRTMASDRGATASFTAEEIDPAWFFACDWLHISGYALFGDGSCSGALRAGQLARAQGATISVDLSSATTVESCGRVRVRELIAEVDAGIIFANEAEQAAAGVLHAPIAVVKRGAAGCTVYEQGTRRDVAAPLVEHVVDTTGAGDAFAAGWLVGGLQLALETARRSVGVRGAMPPKD